MSLNTYLKARLYDLGLDDTGRAELATFVRGVVALGGEQLRRPTRKPTHCEYLHIGCGGDRLPRFINIDRMRTVATDLVVDMRHRLPFPTASVRGIFHQHVFEHIDRANGARTLLSECARVLVPGGMLRMGVPDLAKFVEAYLRFDKDFAGTTGIGELTCAAQILNFAFGHGHRFLYDFAALRSDLMETGFSDIRACGFRDSADPMLNQDKDEPGRLAVTLFVEARR